jgi:hypothetical protein
MRRWQAALAAGALVIGSGLPLRAEQPVVFDLSIRGIPAATLSYTARDGDGRYAVAGRLESSGLVGLLRNVRYEAEATGSVRGKRYTPQHYRESADTGRRRSEAVMDYRRGVPQVKEYSPPREAATGGLDPATQGGTVDPLTAMYAALRDRPADSACDLRLVLFDGERRSQVVLAKPEARDGGLVCAGEYRRLEGFSAEDIAERTRFPFTLRLAPGPDGLMQVVEVRAETLFGRAVMARR